MVAVAKVAAKAVADVAKVKAAAAVIITNTKAVVAAVTTNLCFPVLGNYLRYGLL
ncbi:hypothetical protein EVA_15041 [gut metagenome]|uniref:Uncharacterized protein n=1 Tax=gut metagenome TaxID=749906 RepID=J9FQT7_9ZZZZ